mgnify:CR=1 FL=1
MTYLVKRPVAFRVPRTDPATAGETLSVTEWRLFNDEEAAYTEAAQLGTDYQALYARDGAAIVAEWETIETAPQGDDDFFLVCGLYDERRPFVMRGTILKMARLGNTPSHLSMHYLTHWMPLPTPPLRT